MPMADVDQQIVLMLDEMDLNMTSCRRCGAFVLGIDGGDTLVAVDEFQSSPETLVLRRHDCRGRRDVIPFAAAKEVRNGHW